MSPAGTSMRWRAATALLLALLLAACGTPNARVGEQPVPANWDAIQTAARGQTVRWWLYGGDQRINAYVDRQVAPAAARLGITIRRVPVADTADAVQRVLADRRAGKTTGGAVDLIWVNGENFAAGKKAGLWLKDWVTGLPNSRRVNLDDPAIARDLGEPIDAQEAPWSRAAFVFAADTARTPRPPASFPELLAYAKAHPGRITYPAPPDFTGSAFVRQAVQRLGSRQAGFAFLQALKPYQWRGGHSFPKSEAELNELFANGQVDLAMSYDPSFGRPLPELPADQVAPIERQWLQEILP